MGQLLAVVVHGTPAPQGSKRHVGHGVLIESSKHLPPWREAVRHATQTAMARNGKWAPPYAVHISLTFTLKRPATHYGTGRHAQQLKPNAPTAPRGRPDLDKLIRATLDALTDAGAVTDDATVTGIWAVKTYPAGDLDALDGTGAVIVIREA